MTFPLPGNTFPKLELSEDDDDALRDLADTFVRDSAREFDAFRRQDARKIDPARWKLVRRRGELTSYQDRELRDRRSLSRHHHHHNDARIGGMSFSTKLHGVLTVGFLDGQLDDLMYGLLHQTTDVLRVKSRYTEDKVVDAKVLASIIDATPNAPMHGLHLKWSVSDFAPPFLRRLVRPRDFVYLEATGFMGDRKDGGERIGYNLLHSIQVPGVRELREHHIVRANFSICALFRQAAENKIEVYMKGFVDSLGDIKQAVAVPATAEAMLSFRKALFCAEMKKLTWLLRTQEGSVAVDRLTASECAVCKRSLRSGRQRSRHACTMCCANLCAYCYTPRRLYFLSHRRDQVVEQRMEFCPGCIEKARQLDASKVAREEVEAAQSKFFHSAFLTGSTSPFSLAASPTESIDGKREFFG
jgi:hypothetical protein